MCGVCGFVGEAPGALDRMMERLRHRGPDDAGSFVDGPVSLGHRRLSVIDLSPAARQPLFNEDRTIAVAVNGEIYNYRELRDRLKGHRFASETDSEVIAHLYEEEGPDCVHSLRGMFAFALWDAKRKRLMLARDRLGKKPMVYAETPRGLAFASELQSLLEFPEISREIDPEALDHYLTLQYVPAPLTIYRGVRKLPAGHMLIYEKGVRVTRYWRPDFTCKRKADPGELLELFREAVKLRLVSDVPVGAFLSGGIDSSAVVAMMGGRVKTFTIGFEGPGDETPHAREVARRFGTDHHEEIVRPDAAEILPTLLRHYGEPFADPAAIPTYYLARLARRHVTVALNGDGGDELFAGYGRYSWLSRKRYSERFGFFSRAQKRELLGRAGADTDALLEDRMRESGARTRLEKLLYTDTLTYLPDDLLVKVDIATMAHGLEARSPFLDHRLVEHAASLPAAAKKGKALLKRALKGLLPASIVNRPKQGFVVPIGKWLRGPLSAWAQDHLRTPRPDLNAKSVARLWDEHQRGRDHGLRLWALVVLEAWRRQFTG